MTRKPISVSATTLGANEYQYLIQCLNNRWFSQGYYVREFESRFADYIGVKHALTCSSGTAALHLAMLADGVNSNTSVIIPTLTYVATANAAKYCGAQVRFADVNWHDWCVDLLSVSQVGDKCFEDNPDGLVSVCGVHLYDAISPLARIPDGLGMLIDSAHDMSRGRNTSCAAYSFYASKIISCGEGGMVTTNDDELASRIRLYRGQGATIAGTYHHSVVGYNYRMTDLQAAVGLAQLETLDERIKYRRQIIDRYRERLGGNSKITLQGGERASGWVFACLLPNEIYCNCARTLLLNKYDIETRPFFEPLNSLPMYGSDSSSTPIASEVSRRGICLPTHCELDDTDVDYVCDSLEEVLG